MQVAAATRHASAFEPIFALILRANGQTQFSVSLGLSVSQRDFGKMLLTRQLHAFGMEGFIGKQDKHDVGENSAPKHSVYGSQTHRERGQALPPTLPPRGLSRTQAAAYIGVSPTTFDRMILDKLMPRPARIYGRTVWDIRKLDAAFAALDTDVAEDDPCSRLAL